MATYYITASRKGDASEEHEIVGVCGDWGGYATKAKVYDSIEAGNVFFSQRPPAPNVLVEQLVVNGQKCIRTKADKTKINNLLNLPDC